MTIPTGVVIKVDDQNPLLPPVIKIDEIPYPTR